MKKCDCVMCKFENPKSAATAVVIKDGNILVAKRSQEPFIGQWDFLGGYLQKNETPKEALVRELKEELGRDCKIVKINYIGAFPGTASYKEYSYPLLSFAYLVELGGKMKLNKKENSKLAWVNLSKCKKIAFDSNMDILRAVKEKFSFDLESTKKLVKQLDSSAQFNEQNLYNAILNGYISKVIKNGKLVGIGWIFPRQTLLRKQAVVEDMIVDEDYRGKGLGKIILTDLIKWARKNNVEVIELTTNPKRIAANNLYKKMSFKLHITNHYLLNLV